MASAKQIAANRANALRSSGPKTAAGKLKSSRNSYRHGLSNPDGSDLVTSAKIDILARALTGEEASLDLISSAAEYAESQLQLLRIRAIRSELLEDVDLANTDANELRRIAALDRYERYCSTRRQRASRAFARERDR